MWLREEETELKKYFALAVGYAIVTLLACGSVFAVEPLYFLDHNDLGDVGTEITSWSGYSRMGGTSAPRPTVALDSGQKWASMDATTSGAWGFQLAAPASPIAVTGATFVVAAKRGLQIPSNNWDSIIDVMYDKLTLGIRNDTGQICVRRNGSLDFSTGTIAVGQSTILSLICQEDGSYEVFADGISMLSRGANGTMTEWDPARLISGVDRKYDNNIYVGRGVDGWAAFNGYIGDVKVWTTALTNDQRLLEVSNMSVAMGLSSPSAVPEPGSVVLGIMGIASLAGFRARNRK